MSCWDYNSHIGCSDTDCTSEHTYYKNYEALNTAVKIALSKRYGFKKRNKLPVAKIGEVISDLGKAVQSEIENRRGPPAARGGRNPNGNPTLRAACNPTQNPADLRNIDYLDSEEQLMRNLHGAKPLFGEFRPQEEEGGPGLHECETRVDTEGPRFPETANWEDRINSDRNLDLLKESPHRISSYVKEMVTHSMMEGGKDVGRVVQASLQSASTLGLSPLVEEASKFLPGSDRIGSEINSKSQCQKVFLGFPRLSAGVTVTPMWIGEDEWGGTISEILSHY